MLKALLLPGTLCSLFITLFSPARIPFPFLGSLTPTEAFSLPAENPQTQEYKKAGFIIGWNENAIQPKWIAYELTLDEVYGNQAERKSGFKQDKTILGGTATNEDYRKSGYDRGHLAAAADMKFSLQAMADSFLYSNVSPQVPAFNRGIWAELEAMTRFWAVVNKSVLIAIGPVFLSDEPFFIGPQEIPVPDAFYRVIVDWSLPERKGIAFLIPNAKQKASVFSFCCSIRDIEELTGIDFFAFLPDDIEEEVESSFNPDLWPAERFSPSRHPYPER